MAYFWFEFIADISAASGDHIQGAYLFDLVDFPHPESWWDDFWRVLQGSTVRLSGTLSPFVFDYGSSASIKYLGTKSYRIPDTSYEEGIPSLGILDYPQAGDVLRLWVYVDDTFLGQQIGVYMIGDISDYAFLATITIPPPPPPTFAPLWQMQIGDT